MKELSPFFSTDSRIFSFLCTMPSSKFKLLLKVGLCVVIVSFLIYLNAPSSDTRKSNSTSIEPLSFEEMTNSTCKALHNLQLGAKRKDFQTQVDAVLSDCFHSEKDSRHLASKIDFLHRHRWASLYRKGCSAPAFSRVDQIDRTLVINCPPSMQPKYGFQQPANISQNYTAPVSLDGHEWVYAQCILPFYDEPTVRLHFHAQPLPSPTIQAKKRSNVVFLQFHMLGRYTMHRKMPQSHRLLSSYG